MQETRQRILEILKARGEATVDELSRVLELTPVTIRHHLEVLRSEGLIAPPQARRKGGPGRPQHVYRLAEEADEFFPKNYDHLAEALLTELEERLSHDEMEDLVDCVATRMAERAQVPPDADFATRLDALAEFLNGLGYLVSKEQGDDGQYQLYVANCPYKRVARDHSQPCLIDEKMVSCLLGVSLERLERIVDGDDRCIYTFSLDESSS
jgi:predicted ArsR family transcriptional regulator